MTFELSRRRLVPAMLVATSAAAAFSPVGRASAVQTRTHMRQRVSEADDEPAPAVARRLWSELYCMCGDCQEMTLAACPCDWATKERADMVAQIETLGYSTPDQEQRTHDIVARNYSKRFGEKAQVPSGVGQLLLTIVETLGLALLGVSLIMFLAEKLRAKGQKPAAASAPKKRRRR